MRWQDTAAIIVVLLFAMALRISGTATFGALNPDYLPSTAPEAMLHIQTPIHPDEFQLVTWPVDMILKGHLNPQFFEYPSGLIYLNYVLYQVTGVIQSFDKSVREGANLRTIAPFSLYFFSRMIAVLSGVISVACAYAIMRRVSGRFAAIIAALLLATAFLQVQHAHYIKPEIPSVALMMLVVWTSVQALYARKPALMMRFYILSGIFTGAAATVRYNAAAISIVLFFAGLILLWRNRNRATLFTVFSSWGLFPVVFFIGTPFALLDFPEFIDQFAHITGQFLSTGRNIPNEILTSSAHGFMILLRYLIVVGVSVPATIFIIIGLVGAWRKRPQNVLRNNSELMLVVLLVPYLLAYIFVTMRTVRPIFSDNLLVLIVPQCLLLAAIGAGWLYDSVRLPKKFLVPAITFILLIIPLSRTIPMVRVISQPETRAIMQDWIYQHIPPDSRFLLLEGYNVPLDPAIYPYEQNFNIRSFTLADAENFDYLIVSDARWNLFTRATELVTFDEIAPYLRPLIGIDASFSRIAWINRPRGYLGYNNMLNMATYWHQPGLYLYCLNETACATVKP